MKTILTVIVTAIVTSLFWFTAFNSGMVSFASSSGAAETKMATTGPNPNRPAEGLIVGPSGLAIPVAGIKANGLIDTFSQARAGGARVHDAIDIMAPAGTPVLAAAPGTVEKLFFSEGGGGITAYVRSDDGGWIYYYAHLQDYAPGLAEGQKIQRGALIGRVGSTGNANSAGPHLHFAVMHMATGDAWHEGTPINPYPLLAGNKTGG